MLAELNGHQAQNEGGDYADLGDVSSFKILEGGMEPGDYDAYVGLIDRATLQRLNSPDDFFAEAKFPSEEYGDVVLGYYELGLEQLFARCNNRETDVQYLRNVLDYLDKCREAGRAIESDDVNVVMVAELEMVFRRKKWKKRLKKIEKAHHDTLNALLQGIAYDKQLGVYKDYSALRRKWQLAMEKKESVMGAAVGDIVQDLPVFLRIAISMARRTESDTRRIHIQSLLARVTEKVSDLMQFRGAQNSMGASTARGRRRFLGGGKGNDMD